MSLDATLLSIATSLASIAKSLEARGPVTVSGSTPVVHTVAQAEQKAHTANVQTLQVAPQQPQPQHVASTTSVMQPMFVTPVATASPFGKDEQGGEQTLTGYVMSAYRQMGPIKGAQIQGILVQLGCNNINEVKPEHYAHFVQAVEALKAAP